jgi:hypothetical protein
MCFLDLYEGHGAQVIRRTDKHRDSMKRSMQLRVRTLRFEFQYLEARGALEMLVLGDTDPAHADRVLDRVGRLEAEQNELASAYARILSAALTVHQDSPKAAAPLFERCAMQFSKLSMPMHAAAAQWRQAECLLADGSDSNDARSLAEDARRRLSSHGVQNVEHFARMIAPRISVH